MSKDLDLPRMFQAVLVGDEKILWVGQPAPLAYVVSGIPLLVFGCLWGSFDYFGFIRHMGSNSGFPLGFAIPFFAIHLIPFWAGILNMVRLCVNVGSTYYAVTSTRLMIRGGAWGTNFQSFDLEKIGNFEVSANPIASASATGSLRFYSTVPTVRGTPNRLVTFVGITNPYEVFKLVKQIHDERLPRVA